MRCGMLNVSSPEIGLVNPEYNRNIYVNVMPSDGNDTM